MTLIDLLQAFSYAIFIAPIRYTGAEFCDECVCLSVSLCVDTGFSQEPQVSRFDSILRSYTELPVLVA